MSHQQAVRFFSEFISEAVDRRLRDYGLEPRAKRLPKVDDQQVAQIRELYATGDYTCLQLAQQFNISKHYVRAIVENRRRKVVAQEGAAQK